MWRSEQPGCDMDILGAAQRARLYGYGQLPGSYSAEDMLAPHNSDDEAMAAAAGTIFATLADLPQLEHFAEPLDFHTALPPPPARPRSPASEQQQARALRRRHPRRRTAAASRSRHTAHGTDGNSDRDSDASSDGAELSVMDLDVRCALPSLDAARSVHEDSPPPSKRPHTSACDAVTPTAMDTTSSGGSSGGSTADSSVPSSASSDRRLRRQGSKRTASTASSPPLPAPPSPPLQLIIGNADRRRCSICGNDSATQYHGLACHSLTSSALDTLVHRGWRRIGHNIYRPIDTLACCARYFSRTNVEVYSPAPQEESCLTAVNTFLATGKVQPMSPPAPSIPPPVAPRPASAATVKSDRSSATPDERHTPRQYPTTKALTSARPVAERKTPALFHAEEPGAAGSGGRCAQPGRRVSLSDLCHNQAMRLVPASSTPRHVLELLLVPAKPTPEAFRLYVKHQEALHGRAAASPTRAKFEQEMCDSPLSYQAPLGEPDVPFCGYGSFHAEFRLNGKLVALQALDVLPNGLCPTFLVHEPSLAVLHFKHYVRLRIIELAIQIHSQCAGVRYVFDATPVSLYNPRAMAMLQNDALEVQDVASAKWYPLRVVQRALATPGTRHLSLEGDDAVRHVVDEPVDEDDVRVADGNQVVSLSKWTGRSAADRKQVAQCAHVLGPHVAQNLTLVLNPMPM